MPRRGFGMAAGAVTFDYNVTSASGDLGALEQRRRALTSADAHFPMRVGPHPHALSLALRAREGRRRCDVTSASAVQARSKSAAAP